ncbi:MAG: class I SAM-dependent methyltransferase [Acidobacteriota bacterium]
MKDHAADWEELARREPYFAVLTNDGSRGVPGNAAATAAFFDTGEDDIAALLAAITPLLGHDVRVARALDFGCGAGRLTLPLARRALQVVACDVAPTMLTHARQNAESAGVRNVTFMSSEDLGGLPPGEFDFICSLLVFQYIPAKAGSRILRTLIDLLAPGGIAAIHVTFRRPDSSLRRLARLIRARSGPARRTPGVVRHELQRPYTRINEYDEHSVRDEIEAAGAHLLALLPTHHVDATGAVMIIAKPRSTAKLA